MRVHVCVLTLACIQNVSGPLTGCQNDVISSTSNQNRSLQEHDDLTRGERTNRIDLSSDIRNTGHMVSSDNKTLQTNLVGL